MADFGRKEDTLEIAVFEVVLGQYCEGCESKKVEIPVTYARVELKNWLGILAGQKEVDFEILDRSEKQLIGDRSDWGKNGEYTQGSATMRLWSLVSEIYK